MHRCPYPLHRRDSLLSMSTLTAMCGRHNPIPTEIIIHYYEPNLSDLLFFFLVTHHIIQTITTIVKIIEFALDKIRFSMFRWSNNFRWFNAQQFVCHFDVVRDQLAFKSM